MVDLLNSNHIYGGQAVIEGVMIIGKKAASLAVRSPDGSIWTQSIEFPKFAKSKFRTLPFFRGPLVLLISLILGSTALNISSRISLGDSEYKKNNSISDNILLWFSMMFAVILGVCVFFLGPLFLARLLEDFIESKVMINVIEGCIRLMALVFYISLIGRMSDIKRLFEYHGAEHMTIHAYENYANLDVKEIVAFPKAHPRCGTAFLITVAIVSVIVFSLLGYPNLLIAALSRILLIPIIASLSYELIRFSGLSRNTFLAKLMSSPGIFFQRLTTRYPDHKQIEVAIAAMNHALEADK